MINGLRDHVVDMRSSVSLGESHMCRLSGEEGGSTQEVVFTDFCPGSIIIFRSDHQSAYLLYVIQNLTFVCV